MKSVPAHAVLLFALLLAACSSSPKKDDGPGPDPDREITGALGSGEVLDRAKRRKLDTQTAEQIYRAGRRALDSSDFVGAIEEYDNLSTRFPFADVTTQGELERLYALYRNFEPDRTLSSADRFLREHPRHPAVDYIQYLKGLVNFSRDESTLAILPLDESKADVTSLRRAWDDFATLIQRHPNSPYAGDAYQRMVFIRNRLAEHELHVVDFYLRRGAYVAAAKRAEQIIAQYPGTPSTIKALEALEVSYVAAGMTLQAEDARRVLAAQKGLPANDGPAAAAPGLAPAPAAAAAATPPSPGLLTRIANFFSPLDSSKPGAGTEIVIPSSNKAPEAAAANAPSEAKVESKVEQAAKTEAGSKLEVFMEPYEDAPAAPAAKP